MSVVVRAITPEDDFAVIAYLMNETWNRFMNPQGIRAVRQYRQPDALREVFFPDPKSPEGAVDHHPHGFITEASGTPVAMMGVGISRRSKNGYLLYGFEEGHEDKVPALLEKCMSVVRREGGIQCVRFTTMLPGRIRNAEIAFWEKLGFVADDTFTTLIKLDVSDWSAPSEVDLTGISTPEEPEIDGIAKILTEDGDDSLAEDFRGEYADPSMDTVFLTLNTEGSPEPAGIAYYKVKKFQDKGPDGKVYDGLGAWSVGVHFRPAAHLDRQEKRRFITAVLASMKQLDIIFASARISSRDFDTFIEMLAQGFDFQGQPTITTRLTRLV